jgi:hypothetical protein
MTVGSCLGVVLTLAWARVESLPALYAVRFLMGLAIAATLYEALSRWSCPRSPRAAPGPC